MTTFSTLKACGSDFSRTNSRDRANEYRFATFSKEALIETACEECNGNPCYSHCQKYGSNESE